MMMRQAAHRREMQAQADPNKQARSEAQARDKPDERSMPQEEVQYWNRWSVPYTEDSIASTAGITWENSKASVGY